MSDDLTLLQALQVGRSPDPPLVIVVEVEAPLEIPSKILTLQVRN